MNITIYTTQTCPFCKMTKEYLTKHGIEYTEKDITNDVEAQQEMIDKSGARSVPVIDIDGDIIIGFDREKLNEKLGIEN